MKREAVREEKKVCYYIQYEQELCICVCSCKEKKNTVLGALDALVAHLCRAA